MNKAEIVLPPWKKLVTFLLVGPKRDPFFMAWHLLYGYMLCGCKYVCQKGHPVQIEVAKSLKPALRCTLSWLVLQKYIANY